MFGKRVDGKLVKDLDPTEKLAPLFLGKRMESQNYFLIEMEAHYLDGFIAKKKAEGIDYSYMHVILAALVRVFKMYPKVNRFIMNHRIYQRNQIDVSMVVKKSLREGDAETSIKPIFTGFETIKEVKEKYDTSVNEAITATNNLDKTMILLAKLPWGITKFIIAMYRWLDKHGLLGKKDLQKSLFHCSIFLTNLKSIKMDFAYHHLYNFGNCGFFMAIGKEKLLPHINSKTNKMEPTTILQLGLTMDERYIDGYYYSKVLKTFKRLLTNPEELESPLEESQIYKRK